MTRLTLVLIAVFTITAGVSPPPLEPRRGGNPEQVDLSGDWVLRTGDEQTAGYEQTIRVPQTTARQPAEFRSTRRERRSRGPTLPLFLESGKVLKVSQTDYGLFFSFDRAIVEEYNFGENRTVSIGPIKAQRVSGWEGPVFIIDTMDEYGNKLTERWQLDGDILVRDIEMSKGEEIFMQRRQEFEPD